MSCLDVCALSSDGGGGPDLGWVGFFFGGQFEGDWTVNDLLTYQTQRTFGYLWWQLPGHQGIGSNDASGEQRYYSLITTKQDLAQGDPCAYLNDAGNGVQSWDYNTNPSECTGHGGVWVPDGQGITFKPDGTYSVGPPSAPWGWCSSMEAGGTSVVVFSGGVFAWGFVADATGIGAPVGLFSQAGATFGGTLGATVAGIGALGKMAGLCH